MCRYDKMVFVSKRKIADNRNSIAYADHYNYRAHYKIQRKAMIIEQ